MTRHALGHTLNLMDNSRRRRAFGAKTCALRCEAGLTRCELAELTGTSAAHIEEVEKGQADMGFDLICQLARALNVPVRDLFEF